MPGTFVMQSGQMGAQSSLFVRGGDSDNNKILVDGVSAGDLGGQFDLGPLSTTAVERVEVYRGPNSGLYGADAESGVVNLTTAHGTTSFPSLMFEGDAGGFDGAGAAGAGGRVQEVGLPGRVQLAADQQRCAVDEYHVATTAGNLAGSRTGARRFAGRCITAWMRRACPAHGIFITWWTTRRRGTRICI